MSFEENQQNDYQQESGNNVTQSETNGGHKQNVNLRENFISVKNRLSGQANELGQKMGQKMDVARERTSQTLQTTSRRLDQVANYLHDNNYQDMLQSTRQMVSAHPGKSLLVFLGIGFLLGRSFTR